MRMLLIALSATSLLVACSDESQKADSGSDGSLVDMSQIDGTEGDTSTGDGAGGDLPSDGPGTLDGPRPDATSPDAASPDAAASDSVSRPDLGDEFMKSIEGLWLIGWGGGMNHYSWLKLSVTTATGGTAIILDGAGLKANAPYWQCSGTTSWNLTSTPRTIQLHFPSGTCNGMKSSNYTFGKLQAAGSWPYGALEVTSVKDGSASGQNLEGYRFPASQCTPQLTSCTDPL